MRQVLTPEVPSLRIEIDFCFLWHVRIKKLSFDAYPHSFRHSANHQDRKNPANEIKSHINIKVISRKRNNKEENIKPLASGENLIKKN